jgi:hypothetical protein
MWAREFAGGDLALLGQVVQGRALRLGECDQIVLAHWLLPFSEEYIRDLAIHQHHCGGPLGSNQVRGVTTTRRAYRRQLLGR